MLIGYAAEDEDVFGWDELKLWYSKHRWLVWGLGGLFIGFLMRGVSVGGWEDLGHGNMYLNPPSPGLDFLGKSVQVLAGLLLSWGVIVTLKRWRKASA